MEVIDVEEILEEAGISEKTIFYGVEEIHPTNPIWHVFSLIKRLTPNIVQFYKLPQQAARRRHPRRDVTDLPACPLRKSVR